MREEKVAPFAGARIEISSALTSSHPLQSPPSRGRELKYGVTKVADKDVDVAPFAGARIEILTVLRAICWIIVAPFAGARIEICLQI